MIRPFTAICVLLAGASGLYLYTEKHRTTVLDQQISKIVQDTQHIRERTAMLRAEWALLNQPDRLQALSARFLPELHPMAPTQFVQMAMLARHLPEIARPLSIAAQSSDAKAPDAPSSDAQSLEAQSLEADPAAGLRLAPIQVMARQMSSAAGGAATDPAAIDLPAAGGRPAAGLPMQIASAAVVSGPPAVDTATRHLVQKTRTASPRLAGGPRPAPGLQAAPASAAPASSAPAWVARSIPVAAPARTMQASRMASYEGAPMRASTSGASGRVPARSAYLRPVPMQAAAWRMTTPSGYAPAPRADYAETRATAQPGGQSSLGFSHAAMPAPVPPDGD